MDTQKLQEFIQRELARRGWSQSYLAERMGVSPQTLNSMLKRDATAPKLESLALLAKGFEIPFYQVIESCGYEMGVPQDLDEQRRQLTVLLQDSDAAAVLQGFHQLDIRDRQAILTVIQAFVQRRASEDTDA